MRLVKNFVPSDKAVNIELKCMMKGGVLPPFLRKTTQNSHLSSLPVIQLFPLLVMMLASGGHDLVAGNEAYWI